MTLRDWHFLCIGGNAVALPLCLLLSMPIGAVINAMCIVWCVLCIRGLPK